MRATVCSFAATPNAPLPLVSGGGASICARPGPGAADDGRGGHCALGTLPALRLFERLADSVSLCECAGPPVAWEMSLGWRDGLKEGARGEKAQNHDDTGDGVCGPPS